MRILHKGVVFVGVFIRVESSNRGGVFIRVDSSGYKTLLQQSSLGKIISNSSWLTYRDSERVL